MTTRDVWRCSCCGFHNYADRQTCHRCATRSLGHTLRYGGIAPPFNRQTHIALARKRSRMSSDAEPPQAFDTSHWPPGPVHYQESSGAASSPVPPPMPLPPPAASGHTFNVHLNLNLASQEPDAQHWNSLALSLITLLAEVLHPNKRCRVLIPPEILSLNNSDKLIE